MRISTVIPAFNRAALIGDTLRTVLEQSRPPYEVIVVDDGSTDGTLDVVARFGKAVTLLRQENAGAGSARNAGFAHMTGDVVHFMDSDDLCSRNFYEAAAARLRAGADMTYAPWLKTRIEGRLLYPEPLVMQQGPVPSRLPLDILALLVEWVTVLQPCLISRELMTRAGPYRRDLKPSEDTELLYRLSAASRQVAYVPETLILYRVHPEHQVSEQNLAKRLVDRAHLWSVLREHLAARGDVGWRERRLFRIKSYFVGLEAAAHDPAKAQSLIRAARWHDRCAYALSHLGNRLLARLGRKAPSDFDNPNMVAAPLRARQRALIAEMGYTLIASQSLPADANDNESE